MQNIRMNFNLGAGAMNCLSKPFLEAKAKATKFGLKALLNIVDS